MLNACKSNCLHTVLKANIALGILLFIGAAYFMITGEYANLAMRQHTESILNAVSVGGLVYSVVFWYLDLYFNPQFPVSKT